MIGLILKRTPLMATLTYLALPPLTFTISPGSLTLLSCSFTNAVPPTIRQGKRETAVTVTGCRCVGCSVTGSDGSSGGGMSIDLYTAPESTVSDLYFEDCTSTQFGGGLLLQLFVHSIRLLITFISLTDCSADQKGGGLTISSIDVPFSLTDCEFIRCQVTSSDSLNGMGSGLFTGF
ncbi:hypothetical protein BLNAU_1927 [Blattamonas nauphoetae]|uniref:Uncharacterized protein n=1 Tax=Blattamonas nauphoetae TaxID=2049346 RepID=A0ABQ9YGM6_9EUKA|nr:hypothetical protein BLNAU_1927 [Blattamonas nauphoetae]